MILTLSTAASLYGLYSLYALFVSPLISPPVLDLPVERAIHQSVRSPGPAENVRQAELWLSQADWVADAKYQVLMEKAYIYTNEWKPQEDDEGLSLDRNSGPEPARGSGKGSRIKFSPFALIWHRAGDGPDSKPLTIVSESAVLTFSEKFDMKLTAKTQPGRVIAASLNGAVQIRGNDGLIVTGRDFDFQEAARKVFSANPVNFRYRNSHGSGVGLDMDLIAATGTASKDKPNISGVRTLRLLKDVVMHMMPGGDEKKSKTTFSSDSDPKKPGKDSSRIVTITSRGRFEYVVEATFATFQDNVQVRSPTGPNEFDTLRNCDFLTLIFERVNKKKPGDPAVPEVASKTEPAAGKKKADQGDLEFRRMKAEGKPVVLHSERSQMTAQAAELVYDAEARVVALKDNRLVHVIQKNQEIFANEISVQLDSAGKMLSSRCQGNGSVRSYDPVLKENGKPKLMFGADWKRQMQRYPDATGTLDVVELEGDAVLHQPGKLHLKGELVKIWFTPEDKKGNEPPALETSPGKPGSQKNRSGAKPKRLLAREDVEFRTPTLEGRTNQLEVWFEPGVLPKHPRAALVHRDQMLTVAADVPVLRETAHKRRRNDAPAAPATVEEPKRIRTSAVRRGTAARGNSVGFAEVADPAPAEEAVENPEASPPRKPAKKRSEKQPAHPLFVKANLIRVRTLQEGNESAVAEVWTEGRVHVTQKRDNPQKPGKEEPPLEVHGDRLHLWNYVGNSQFLRIIGQPADVRDRGLQLEGAIIELDRLLNTLHVEGAGTLRLPLQTAPDGKKLAEPQYLDVWWKERMDFNGLVATFLVDVKSRFGENRVKCQEMEVQLTKRVSFSEGNAEGQKAEVDLVSCKEGVEIDNSEYKGNRLVEVRKAKTWQLTMSQRTGDLTASGPGIVKLWRRSEGNRSSEFGINRTSRAKPAPEDEETPVAGWEYTRVDFAGEMQGNRNQRSTTFKDRVRVVHGPVADSTEVLDEHGINLPRNGGWMKSESLQLTQHAAKEQQPASMEMLASGNAEMGGGQGEYSGQADTISYDQSKGLFLLRSVGTRMATIWRQPNPGQEPSRVEAQWMEYIPKGNKLKLDRTSAIQGLP